MEQRTAEWHAARLGHVTASRFADVLTQPRNKADVLSKTAETYLFDLLGEHLTRQPASTLKTFAMEWGTQWEPVARQRYEEQTDTAVEECGFVLHPLEQFVGCSPDGLGDCGKSFGGLEIKCPITAANHLRVLMSRQVPDEHEAQVRGCMWVTGAEWWDYVSFHPHFPLPLQLVVIRIERDREYEADMAAKVLAFRDHMVKQLKDIITYWSETDASTTHDDNDANHGSQAG